MKPEPYEVAPGVWLVSVTHRTYVPWTERLWDLLAGLMWIATFAVLAVAIFT